LIHDGRRKRFAVKSVEQCVQSTFDFLKVAFLIGLEKSKFILNFIKIASIDAHGCLLFHTFEMMRKDFESRTVRFRYM
jgi:hypothetical protein